MADNLKAAALAANLQGEQKKQVDDLVKSLFVHKELSVRVEYFPGPAGPASGFIGAVVTCLPLTFLNLVPLLPKPEKFRSYGLRDK